MLPRLGVVLPRSAPDTDSAANRLTQRARQAASASRGTWRATNTRSPTSRSFRGCAAPRRAACILDDYPNVKRWFDDDRRAAARCSAGVQVLADEQSQRCRTITKVVGHHVRQDAIPAALKRRKRCGKVRSDRHVEAEIVRFCAFRHRLSVSEMS